MLVTLLPQSTDQRNFPAPILVRSLEGWAEADLAKIGDGPISVSPAPLMDHPSQRSLPQSFQHLLVSIGHSAGFALRLHGPWDRPSHQYDLRLWREASRIG